MVFPCLGGARDVWTRVIYGVLNEIKPSNMWIKSDRIG